MKNYDWKYIHIIDKFKRNWDIDINLCDYKYYPINNSKYVYVVMMFNNEPIQSRFITKKLMREKKLERIVK